MRAGRPAGGQQRHDMRHMHRHSSLGGSRPHRLGGNCLRLLGGRLLLGLLRGLGLLHRLLGRLLLGHLGRALGRLLVVVKEGLRDLEGAELVVLREDTVVLPRKMNGKMPMTERVARAGGL